MSEERGGQLHRGKLQHRAADQRGAAMIVVICVLMVVMILCLTIIVGAYQTLATVQDGRKDTAYYTQAYSFSEALRDRITWKEGDPAPVVKETPTDLQEKIIAFAADQSLFGTEEDPVEEPSITLTEDSRSGSSDAYGTLVLTLKKRKVNTDKVRLFITTSVTENFSVAAGKKDVLWEAACTAGYQAEFLKEGDEKKCRLTFRGYY